MYGHEDPTLCCKSVSPRLHTPLSHPLSLLDALHRASEVWMAMHVCDLVTCRPSEGGASLSEAMSGLRGLKIPASPYSGDHEGPEGEQR